MYVYAFWNGIRGFHYRRAYETLGESDIHIRSRKGKLNSPENCRRGWLRGELSIKAYLSEDSMITSYLRSAVSRSPAQRQVQAEK